MKKISVSFLSSKNVPMDLRKIDVDECVAEVIASEKTGELVSDGQVKSCKKRVREKI